MRLVQLIAWAMILTVCEPVLADNDAVSKGQECEAKAIAFLKAQQRPDGSFQRSDREPPAITALVIRAISQSGKLPADSPEAKKGVAYLLSVQQPDGGIHRGMLANYSTAICLSGLAAMNDPSLKPSIEKAIAYLKSTQFSDTVAGPRGEKIDPKNPAYGGWNYGRGQRGGVADVSNTATVLDALKDAGVPSSDPAYQRALTFVSRLQNNSETNPASWASNDGGFIYNIGRDGNGESAAGEYTTADGKRMLRSYGSMTYAGLKSMIYAGLAKDDPRVKAAWKWVQSHWSLDEHPGMAEGRADEAQAGIFYYYHTLAKALAVYGEPAVVDAKQVSHDWRVELIEKLASIQKPDGSFTGINRWMEDNPMISTPLATLALQEAMINLKEHPAGK